MIPLLLSDLAGFTPAKPGWVETPPDSLQHYCVQRKYDGQRLYVFVDKHEEVHLVSRGNHVMTKHLPLLTSLFKQWRLPAGTLLDGEFTVTHSHTEDFLATGSILRSTPERAARLEQTLPVKYVLFDVLYYQGLALWPRAYEGRYWLLQRLTAKRLLQHRGVGVGLPDLLPSQWTWTQALAHVKAHRWEGLVLWPWGHPTVVRFDGHAARTGCYRWKPTLDDDFVVTGFQWGKGKHTGRMGALVLAQYTGDVLHPMGTVGTGFDDATRTAALQWTYPCVARIAYGERTPRGRLRFPRFIGLRTDKRQEECQWDPGFFDGGAPCVP